MTAIPILILAATFAAQVLPAPNSVPAWAFVAEDASGRIYVDPASVRRDGDIARILVRGVAKRPAASGASVMMMRFRFDCRQRTIGIEAVDGYGADGRLTGSREATPETVAAAPVGNVASTTRVFERACGAPAPAR